MTFNVFVAELPPPGGESRRLVRSIGVIRDERQSDEIDGRFVAAYLALSVL